MKSRVATSPEIPTTIHYRGDGLFMIAGRATSKWRKGFRPENLWWPTNPNEFKNY
jgi:hypothetical protein